MFSEDNLLPISALQHLAFCERQWALIHLEGQWMENRLTVEGKILHERADTDETEVRGDFRIARGLRLRSLRLGLSGRADIVEFHQIEDSDNENMPEESVGSLAQSDSLIAANIMLSNAAGRWHPIPIEYKHGRVKNEPIDEVQLCAQAFCLEEMLSARINVGYIFYGKTRRRHAVMFDDKLRTHTESLIHKLHMMNDARVTPVARYEKKCDNCSLYDACLPKTIGQARSVKHYLDQTWRSVISG